MDEVWRPVPGYEGFYDVSSLGRVRSHHVGTPLVMVGRIDRYGYHTVLLSLSGIERRMKVHRLVCEAFHGPCPSGHEVAHLDGKKLHNTPENLVWATRGENERHKYYHGHSNLVSGGAGANNPNAKLSDEQASYLRSQARNGRSTRDIARELGISQSRVVRIKNMESYAAASPTLSSSNPETPNDR